MAEDTTDKIKIGITHGDINGIGYEVILKMLEDERMLELFTPVIYGSGKIAAFYRKQLGLAPLQLHTVATADEAADDKVNIINVVDEDVKPEPGQPSKAAGAAALAALEAAVADLRRGAVDAILTAPINKDTIQADNFKFPGHTEYLEAALAPDAAEGQGGGRALMVLCGRALKVALVTTHAPIAEVPARITRANVADALRRFHRSLREDFAISSPRIAVLALNPHAGENGMLGAEEQREIIPAIEDLRQERAIVFGPYAADGFFGSGAWQKFDGVLAMYHDQGLAPFKLLDMDGGVNFTAGLPYVRTSPDHGTAYDLAGTGEASPESMRQALYAAIDIVNNRRRHAEATANPLKKQTIERRPRKQAPDKGAEKPAGKPADRAPEKPAEKPAENTVETPAETPAE